MTEEILDIVDGETGVVTGQAPRSLCHGHPELVHRAVHILIFHPDGRILLQKRALTKQVQPGKWDMSVGGHMAAGEDWKTGVLREMKEELGLDVDFESLKFLFDLKLRNDFESENVKVYSCISAGPFIFQKEEIDAIAFFDPEELRRRIGQGNTADLTPLLCRELGILFRSPAI